MFHHRQARRDFPTRPQAQQKCIITGPKYRFTILTDGLLRYEWAPDSKFEDRASTFAINRDLPAPQFTSHEKDGFLYIRTKRFHFVYDKKNFSPNGFHMRALSGISDHKSEWRYGEHVYGLGGTARTLDDVDGRIELEPGVIARNGIAVIDDSKTMLFDETGWVAPRQEGEGRVDGYVFVYGHDYREAIQAFYALSGPQPLLPRWALGNWWSRYYAYEAAEYVALMDKFEEKQVPLSVAVIDMDWHVVNDERVKAAGVSGWTGYTWNEKLFPNPKSFCKALHDRGFKITLNDHPADGIACYEDLYEEIAKALGHDTNHKDPIDFDLTDPKFFDAYFDILHRKVEDDGCDFWWIDWQSGPYSRINGVDPLWMLNHYHFLDNKAYPEATPLIFSRYAGPGSHRYPVGFSGDTIVTWESLDFQPEFTATSSNIGYGWWSHDIGGHMGGYRSDELTARWVQLGVFSPVMRLHSSLSMWQSKEPWLYGNECESIMIEMLRFRHKLLPYLYTMNVRAARAGEQLVQPLYWDWPKNDHAYQFKNQFYFGSELLVTPITKPRDPATRLAGTRGWLPPGRFVDIFTGTVYEGDRILSFYRRLDQYPTLAPHGAIIPLDASPAPANGGNNPEAFRVIVVVGSSNRFTIIEDGKDDVASVEIPISFDQESGSIRIGPASSAASPSARGWTLDLIGYELNEDKISATGNESLVLDVKKSPQGVSLKIDSHPLDKEILVQIGEKPQLRKNDVKDLIYSIIMDAQISFELKDQIWDAVTAKVPQVVQASRVEAIGLEEAIRAPVLELLLADVQG